LSVILEIRVWESKIFSLQYQLLHAVAGTLAEAKKHSASNALFMVHTFVTKQIDKEKFKMNNKKLNDFVEVISSGKYKKIIEGEILGPFNIAGNELIPPDIPLYIGKLTTLR